MNIVQINTFSHKATGSIMMSLHNELNKREFNSYVVWGRGKKEESKYEIFMYDKIGVGIHGIYTRMTDKTGFASKRATKRLIKQLDNIKPDIIHLHNLHGYYINIEILFNYIKENNIKTIWTLHDCWSITGHCAYFDAVNCKKWIRGCNNCIQLNTYPKSSLLDNSQWNWNKKKELFSGLNMKLVTPSIWLAKLVKQSYLREYPIEVINNGIDLEVFKPVKSEFRNKYGLKDKFIILGVASEWTKRKGLDDFIKLSKALNDSYKIILIGLTKKQISEIPKNIIAIERTNNINELVQIYSEANIFFNPTYEDNFPTTNLEAMACGTLVYTYNTGGSAECIGDYGEVFEKGEIDKVINVISSQRLINKEQVINSDKESISKETMIKKYIKLYNEMI